MTRLDHHLKSSFSSRQKAQEAIESGCVKLNGKVVYKSSILVSEEDCIEIDTQDLLLGRAGYKLRGIISQLESLQIWDKNYLADKKVLDVGSSTGGFAQVLLESNAKEITCIDVGKNQLHEKLRTNSKITLFEECDIRSFQPNQSFDLVVCDVSFISLHKLLPYFQNLKCSEFLWLFKPQFEVGKEAKRNKKGVLVCPQDIQLALERFYKAMQEFNFQHITTQKSHPKGKEGNEEFFILGRTISI